MVTDRSEKSLDENRSDCESRTSSGQEIPKLTGVANISCPKLNEVLCCQKLAYSVLFYIFVALFLLFFVYILRKLVSLPVSVSKNGSRKPSNSATTAVHGSNSSDAITKRLPHRWPKIGNIMDSLTPTAIIPPKDKKSRIYNVAKIGEQSYGWSGFEKNNPNPNLEGTTPSQSQDFQENYGDHGTVSSDTTSVPQDKNNENIFNPSFSNPIGANPSIAENSGLGKTASSFSSNIAENSGLENTRNVWTAWDYPASSGVEKTGSDLSTSADLGFSGLGKKDSRLSAWNFKEQSGSDLTEGRYATAPQNSGSGLPNRVTGATASVGNNKYLGTKSSTWPKWGSSWPDGSGFGWYRENERNPKNPNTRFYYDRVSGKWTYYPNNVDAYNYNYNYNPTSKMGINVNAGDSSYSEAISSNTWHPYYNYGETNQTEDWTNLNVPNGQSGEMLKPSFSSVRQSDFGNFGNPSTTNQNQEMNQRHQTSAKISGEELDDSIHRWPLEEGRGEEQVNDNSKQFHTAISSHSTKQTRRVNHTKSKKSKQSRFFVQKFPKTKRKPKSGKSKGKRKGKASYHKHHSLKNGETKISKKTEARNNIKKFAIPHRNVLQVHRKRPQVEHWKVKSKVKLRIKKPWLSPKVRRHKERLHEKRRRKNTATRKNRPKRLPRRFLSYSSYKTFLKRHQISDVLVGKWHHTVYRVRHCKTLSQFKTDGLVQLGKQYVHRKRKYKYTILSCRHVDKENNDSDGSQDREDDSDTIFPSGSQICREFWYITSGKITLRKLKGNTYIVTLCNTGSSSTDSSVKAPEDEDETTDLRGNDDADRSVDNGEKDLDANDNRDKDLDSDVSGDNDDNDNSDTNKETVDRTDDVDIDDKTDAIKRTGNDNNDDDNIDFDDDDNDSNGPDKTKSPGKEEHVDDKNSNDDDDFNKGSDNDSQKKDTYNESKDDDTATETDDILMDSTSSGGSLATRDSESDDKAIEDDDDLDLDNNQDIEKDKGTDTKNKYKRRRKNSVRKNKGNDIKMHRKRTKSTKKKSLITKNHHRRFKLHKKFKTNNDRMHKTPSNRPRQTLFDATDDKSNLYKLLRQVLVKNQNLNDDEDGALAKLVATISQKKSNSELSEKRNNKKARIHSRKTKSKIRKGTSVKKKESPLFRKKHITITQDIRTILQKLLTNSKNVESLSQGMKKQLMPEQKVDTKGNKKDTTTKVSVKPASQVDTTDILKALLPRLLPGSTAVTTAAPVPTIQPTVQATTHAPNPVPILSLLRKLGIKASLDGKTSPVLEGRLPEKKSRDGLSTDKLLETKRTSSFGQGVPPLKDRQLPLYPNTSELIPSNPGQQSSVQIENSRPENSLRSNIPAEKSTQDFLSSPTSSPPLPTPTTPTFTTEERNAIADPRLQGTKYGKTSDSTSGYSTYRSPKNNGYSLQAPSINVLCFGDSLTSGYYNHGRGKHPYSIRLSQLLNPGGTHHYTIVTRGVVGEMAHGTMTKRMPKVLNEGTRFDWVLILGGTNDVAHVKNFGDDEQFTRQLISVWSPKIVKDIEQLHATARQYGARTVLMTVPETAYELWPEFQSIRNMRLSVNAALRQYATQVRDTTVLCDLAIKLPRSTLSKELQKFYWNDHIHMNPVGYNKMGEIIEQCIRPYLSK